MLPQSNMPLGVGGSPNDLSKLTHQLCCAHFAAYAGYIRFCSWDYFPINATTDIHTDVHSDHFFFCPAVKCCRSKSTWRIFQRERFEYTSGLIYNFHLYINIHCRTEIHHSIICSEGITLFRLQLMQLFHFNYKTAAICHNRGPTHM